MLTLKQTGLRCRATRRNVRQANQFFLSFVIRSYAKIINDHIKSNIITMAQANSTHAQTDRQTHTQSAKNEMEMETEIH